MNDQPSHQIPDGTRPGYVTFVARLWIDQGGQRVRGMLQDAHTGAQLPIDLSGLIRFVQSSLDHSVDGGIDDPSPPRDAARD